jgi:methylmalonyl-CoA mutase
VERLASNFAPVDKDRWRELAKAALRNSNLAKLATRNEDGFSIQPIYARAVGPPARRAAGQWRIAARIDHPDSRQSNDFALDDLANGADCLQLIFAGAAGAYGYGLAKWDERALGDLFERIDLDAGVWLDLDLGPARHEQALAVAAFDAKRAASGERVDLSFGLDPLGALTRSGRASEDWGGVAQSLARTARSLRDKGFAGPFVVADGRCIHDSGGTPGQELGYVLACALDYLRALSANGFTAEAARDSIAFHLAADADEFVSVSKFRALRLLWARALEACDLLTNEARVSASSAWRMLSVRDPWINVMRGAMAAFSAGLGGADSISILPFTQAVGLPDAFARRLARNAQLVLLEESHLGSVVDPVAGSGAFEALTSDICESAWSQFQYIESHGGVYAALGAGEIQAAIYRAFDARSRQIAARKYAIIGVSDFPDLGEADVATVPAAKPAFDYPGELGARPLVAHRLSEPFELFRERSDAIAKRTGSRPYMFLANIGSTSDSGTEALFAKGLFEAGGIATRSYSSGGSVAEIVAAFVDSGATLACLCPSSIDAYAALATKIAQALRESGAQMVVCAGKPGDNEAALRVPGFELFVNLGGDALAVLSAIYDRFV